MYLQSPAPRPSSFIDVATPTASTTNLIPQSQQTNAPAPSSSTTQRTPATTQSVKSTSPKDYESAFATLSSSYGWGGLGVPMKTPKKEKKEKKEKKDKKDKKDKKGKAAATSSSPSAGQDASTLSQSST
ncbi:hypothetical protein L227DRAFT_578579 [Lentinus tigrinus ALCF2SS1-6]|uniref:Uncharacterized protein n=1 Tax=Lentinus tigrinus ALCF2SS1-6 TaxID=1328759 RepID=A0A5C2RZW0_9APHY|nr:hypothetical protein L227DRAFT_578579 [Lentinus tigrinus ALCF2SS1-6]